MNAQEIKEKYATDGTRNFYQQRNAAVDRLNGILGNKDDPYQLRGKAKRHWNKLYAFYEAAEDLMNKEDKYSREVRELEGEVSSLEYALNKNKKKLAEAKKNLADVTAKMRKAESNKNRRGY